MNKSNSQVVLGYSQTDQVITLLIDLPHILDGAYLAGFISKDDHVRLSRLRVELWHGLQGDRDF